MLKKSILIFSLVLGAFFASLVDAPRVLADVSITGTDVQGLTTDVIGSAYFGYQDLGTGITGSVSSVSLDFDVVSSNGFAQLQGGVLEYSSESNYNAFMGGTQKSWNNVNTLTAGLKHLTPTISGSGLDGYSFDSSKWYRVYEYASCTNGYQNCRLLGSSVDEYSTGDASYVGTDWRNGMVDLNVVLVGLTSPGSSAPNTVTRIDTVTPENASTVATSTALTVGFTGYVNEDDWVDGEYFELELRKSHPVCEQAAGIGFLDCGLLLTETYENVVSGSFSYSTTTAVLDVGEYTLNVAVMNPRWYWWDEEVVASSTYFTAVEPTWFDTVYSSHSTSSPFALQYQTATTSLEAVRNMCNPVSFSFSMSDCLLALIIPRDVEGFTKYTRTQVLSKWPIGYVTDLVDIFSATSTSALPVINAVVPAGIPGAGATIYLSLDHVLDPFLNATSSFSSGSATSTATLYDITSYYWQIIVYVLAGFYILRRILGSHVIPHFGEYIGSDSAMIKERYRGSSKGYNERQRYNDWLYKHKK